MQSSFQCMGPVTGAKSDATRSRALLQSSDIRTHRRTAVSKTCGSDIRSCFRNLPSTGECGQFLCLGILSDTVAGVLNLVQLRDSVP